jgi:hypothetical protein
MSIITTGEWSDWKINPVTRAFYDACNQRINDCKDILAGSAGMDSDTDNFYRGFIAAYSEMFGFHIEDLDNED